MVVPCFATDQLQAVNILPRPCFEMPNTLLLSFCGVKPGKWARCQQFFNLINLYIISCNQQKKHVFYAFCSDSDGFLGTLSCTSLWLLGSAALGSPFVKGCLCSMSDQGRAMLVEADHATGLKHDRMNGPR